jgi:hypothetical protein
VPEQTKQLGFPACSIAPPLLPIFLDSCININVPQSTPLCYAAIGYSAADPALIGRTEVVAMSRSAYASFPGQTPPGQNRPYHQAATSQ